MKERPILYSTPMVQAKLAGRKTQTRRLSGLDEVNHNPSEWTLDKMDIIAKGHSDFKSAVLFIDGGERVWIQCPYGKVGDILWARETLRQSGELGLEYFANAEWIDEAIIPEDHKPYRNYAHCNIPNIHMPKWAARIWERITNIRVERLQDISEYDARCEGHDILLHGEDSIAWYKQLWESINGPGSWELNPWVWAITTEVLSTTGRPSELVKPYAFTVI